MAKIKEFNENPEWSDYIMDYEEKILEREQDTREITVRIIREFFNGLNRSTALILLMSN